MEEYITAPGTVFLPLEKMHTDYMGTLDESTKHMVDTDEMLKGILDTLKSNFNEVSKSERTKHKYLHLYAKSIAEVAMQRNALRKDIAMLGEKRLVNSLKVKTLFDAVKNESKETFDIEKFHNSVSDMFS